MRLFLLTTLTMLAFAANSLLNRAALLGGGIDPASFVVLRVASGVVMLFVLLALRGGIARPAPDLWAVLGLTLYMVGFSYAYLSMDAGVGALILFAGVQVTMFMGAVRSGERPPLSRWGGAGAALGGLTLLLWPSEGVDMPVIGFALMSIAAFGWGVYSLIGRGVRDPLAATAWNFLYSFPLVAVVWIVAALRDVDAVTLQPNAIWLAICSGAITSGLGYALWYKALPQLGATRAALAQLSVPVIALGLGALWLGEELPWRVLVAAVIVLGGIALGLLPGRRVPKG